MADLRTLFRNAVATASDQRGKPALLGKTDGTLYWSSARRDKVWARIGETGSNQEAVVRCTAVTPQLDMPVRVDMVGGVLSVTAVDEARYLNFSGNRPGGNVAAHSWLHGRLGPDPLYLTGLQYLPLLVHPSNPAALTVTVEQGAYRWDGSYKILETADSGSLSAYVPMSAATKHFVIICLDRANNALVIVDGDDVTVGGDALFGGASVTVADVTAVTIAAAYLPLAAVLLYYGQTEVRAADIVMDLRQWGNEAGTSTGLLEGGVVVNEAGADVDFRIESNDDANAFVIDGGTNRAGFGVLSPAAAVEIANTEVSTTPETGLLITNTHAPTSAPGAVFPQSLNLVAQYSSAQNAVGGILLAQFLDVKNTGAGVINVRALDIIYRNQGAGTVGRIDDIYIRTPQNTGGGAITLSHGIYIDNQNVAATSYAIYTNAGDIRLMSSAADKIGFHGSAAVAKQTVTGSRGGNAALADLLTKLATLGLITDSTT